MTANDENRTTARPVSVRILRDALHFAGSGYVAGIFNAVAGVVVRRGLGPAAMGLVAELTVFLNYAGFHHLGMVNALTREVPFARGRNDEEGARVCERIAFAVNIGTAWLVALGFVGYAAYSASAHHRELTYGLYVFALLIVIESVRKFYETVLRARHSFRFLSRYLVAVAIVGLAAKAVFVPQWQFFGMLWALVIVSICSVAILAYTSGLRFGRLRRSDLERASSLWRVGFPLMLYGLARWAFLSLDRVMILLLYDRAALGYYSIALMMQTYLVPLSMRLNNVVYPRLVERFAQRQRIEDVRQYLMVPTLVIAFVMPLVLGVVALVLPSFLRHLLPQFERGLMPAHIFLVGVYFYSVAPMWSHAVVAQNRQHLLVVMTVFTIAIAAAMNYVFARYLGLGLTGIALGTSLAHAVYMVGLILYVCRSLAATAGQKLALLIKLVVPLVWGLGMFLLVQSFGPAASAPLVWELLGVAVRCLIFAIFCLPLLIFVNRQTHLWRMLRASLRRAPA